MAENKTQPTKQSIASYIKSLPNAKEQEEATKLVTLFKEITKAKPVMWGVMVGFGSFQYKYASGRGGVIFATGFAMRKSGPTIYSMLGHGDYKPLLKDLGPHKLGGGCLYLKSLESTDLKVLKKIIKIRLANLKKQFPVVMK